MSYEFIVIPREGYLHFQVRGMNNKENVMSYLARIPDECRVHKCNRVLIEENLEGPGLDLASIFNISSMPSEPVSEAAVLTIAFVDVNPEHSFDNMKFAETLVVNRAGNIRVFAALPEAEAWIRKGP